MALGKANQHTLSIKLAVAFTRADRQRALSFWIDGNRSLLHHHKPASKVPFDFPSPIKLLQACIDREILGDLPNPNQTPSKLRDAGRVQWPR